jgi:hypothetical protein
MYPSIPYEVFRTHDIKGLLLAFLHLWFSIDRSLSLKTIGNLTDADLQAFSTPPRNHVWPTK